RPPTAPRVSQRSSTTWLAPFATGGGSPWHRTSHMARQISEGNGEISKVTRGAMFTVGRRVVKGELVAIVGGNCWRALPMKRDSRPLVQPVAGDTLVVIGNDHAIDRRA